jgi:hypothetical protein
MPSVVNPECLSRIRIFPSPIPDPTKQRGGESINKKYPTHQAQPQGSHEFHKIETYLIFEQVQKDLSQLTKNEFFLTQYFFN